MDISNVTIIRARRKTVSIRIRYDGTVEVRAPLMMAAKDIENLLREKSGWIESHRRTSAEPPLMPEDIRSLACRAKEVIPERAAYFGTKMGVTYGKITIRNQTGRWGSCGVNGNLNFNCLLMLAPEAVLDYVVVHELAHRIHMDHSRAFWQEVEKIQPDYRQWRKWLRENGGALIARMERGMACVSDTDR